MEAISSSDRLVTTYTITRSHNPEEHDGQCFIRLGLSFRYGFLKGEQYFGTTYPHFQILDRPIRSSKPGRPNYQNRFSIRDPKMNVSETAFTLLPVRT
jgi:hypothetical protein